VRRHNYATKGVCSKAINFKLDNGIVRDVGFIGGCDGNLKGLSLLAEGRPALEVAEILDSVVCSRSKAGTSCPAQLALALREAAGKSAKSASSRKPGKALEAGAKPSESKALAARKAAAKSSEPKTASARKEVAKSSEAKAAAGKKGVAKPSEIKTAAAKKAVAKASDAKTPAAKEAGIKKAAAKRVEAEHFALKKGAVKKAAP
jgi:uncharacterized protein (TIGR03905 family)